MGPRLRGDEKGPVHKPHTDPIVLPSLKLQRTGHFLHFKDFQGVANLDIVVVLQ